MISTEGEVKLIDFGIAKARTRRTDKTHIGELKGKLAYMSPEQARGDDTIDCRSDVFSMGVVFFEILSGEKLFDNDSELGLLRDVSHVKFSEKRLNKFILNSQLKTIILRCVQKEPKKRFSTADEIRHECSLLLKKHGTLNWNTSLKKLIQEVVFKKEIIPSREIKRVYDKEKDSCPDEKRSNIIETKNVSQSENARVILEKAYSDEDSISNHSAGLDNIRDQPLVADSMESIPKMPIASRFQTASEDEEPKTIIDIIRLSARSHKKELIRLGIGLGITFIIFLMLDVFSHWTALGRGIYDIISPPTIYLKTIPKGASIIFNDNLYKGNELIRIPKVKPGMYTIRCQKAGYQDIVKSIDVKRKGVIIGGEEIKQNHTFVFASKVNIYSIPPGAMIYINGARVPELTPFEFEWAVNEPLELKLEKAGFDPITGFRLDLIKGNPIMSDVRWWEFDKKEEEQKTIIITGKFWKEILIQSVPSGAEVYLRNDPKKCMITGDQSKLKLSVGQYNIRLKKINYLDDSFLLNVDEHTNTIKRVLYRNVRIEALDNDQKEYGDLHARIIKIGHGNHIKSASRSLITPLTYTMGPWTYKALLSVDGYQDTLIHIHSNQWNRKIFMKKLFPIVRIQIKNAVFHPKEEQTRIYYTYKEDLEGHFIGGELNLGLIDTKGYFQERLKPGKYEILIRSKDYYPVKDEIWVDYDQANDHAFELVQIQNEKTNQ
jgi:serine/threonine protein kinase